MKFRSTVLAAALSAALVATAGPAGAVTAEQRIGTGTVTATTTVAGVYAPAETCITIPVDYAVALPPTAADWMVDLVATRPDGTVTEHHAIASSYTGDPLTGAGEFLACTPLVPGTWTLTPRVEWREGAEEGVATAAPIALDVQTYVPDFKVKAKRKGSKVTITAKFGVKTVSGVVPVAGIDIAPYFKKGKKYKAIKKGAGVTNAKGVFTIKTSLRRGAKVKILWLNNDNVETAANGYHVEYLAAGQKDVRIR